MADELVLCCQAMDISHGTLNRYFQEGEGCSAQAWFQMIRAEHAYSLLTNGAMSMEEVAAEVGLTSTRSLHRMLVKQYGASVRELTKKS